jgi:hypothetical protein
MQMHEWTVKPFIMIPPSLTYWTPTISQEFIGGGEFCFRACKPGPNARTLCQHIYDQRAFHIMLTLSVRDHDGVQPRSGLFLEHSRKL